MLENARQHCDIGCWMWIAAARKFYWTKPLFQLFGMPESGDGFVSPDEWTRIVHASDKELVKRICLEIASGKQVDATFKILNQDEGFSYLQLTSAEPHHINGEQIPHGCCRNVTTERAALQIIKEQMQEMEWELKIYRNAEHVSTSGTWQINLDTHSAWYSDNLFRLYGIAPVLANNHLNTFSGFVHPEDKEIVTNASDLAYKHCIPLHLEYRILRPDGETRYLRVVSDVRKNIDGETFLTGITQDITEQKELETQLRSSYERLDISAKHFRHTEQLAQTGTWQINLETRMAAYSDNLYRLYGLKAGQPNGAADPFLQFVFNEDRERVKDAVTKMFDDGVPPTLNFRIVRPDGKLRYFTQAARQIYTSEGEQLMIAVVQDITEQQLLSHQLQHANASLRLQNEAFTQAEQTAAIGTWRWNLETNDIFYSDNIYRIYGLRPQSVLPGFESFQRYFHPDDVEQLRNALTTMKTDQSPVEVDYRIYRADGELRYIRGRNKIYISEHNERILIGTTQDVTNELLMRQKLDEQLRFIKLLSNHLVDQLVVTNTSNVIVEVNRATEEMQGIDKEDVLGKNFFEAFPQLRIPAIIENFKRALKGEMVFEKNITSPISRGHIERYHIPVKDEHGKVEGVLTVVRDVTEELKLRDALQERVHFIERLLDASVTAITALDTDLNYTICNKRAEQLFGLPKESIVGRNVLALRPALKKEAIYEEIKRCLSGEIVYLPPAETALDGYHETHLAPLRDANGEVNGLLWVITDLSERREAEKKIEEARTLLLQTAEATPDAITIYDMAAQHPIYINTRLADWIGMSSEDLADLGMEGRLLLIHPDDRQRLTDFVASMHVAHDEEIRTLDYRILNRNRSYLWIHNRTKVFERNSKGEVTRVISVLQEITRQKKAENELRDTKQFTEEITRSIPDLITIADAIENRITYCNHHAFWEGMYDKEQIYQMNDSQRVRAMFAESCQDAAVAYMAKRKTLAADEVTEAELQLVSGKWIHVRSKIFKRDENGEPLQVISFSTDITAKKTVEFELIRLKDQISQSEIDKYHAIINSFEDAVAFCELLPADNHQYADYRFIEFNTSFESVRGLKIAEITGRTASAVYGTIEKWLIEAIETVVQQKKAVRLERLFQQRWWDIGIYPYKGQYFTLVFRDITERINAEQQLRDTEQKATALNCLVPALLWQVDPSGKKMSWNERWLQYTGMRYEESQHGGWVRAIHPDDKDASMQLIEDARLHPREIELQHRIRHYTGEYRWFLVRQIPVFDNNGKLVQWYGAAFDIHNQKMAEQELEKLASSLEQQVTQRTRELHQKNQKLEHATRECQQILNAMPHYVWTTLADGMPFFHNAYFIKHAGVDLEGNPDAWLSTIHPEDLEKTKRIFHQAITSGTDYYNEVRIRNNHGVYRWHIARMSPLKDKSGKIKLWVGTATDIHDLQVAEKRLRNHGK